MKKSIASEGKIISLSDSNIVVHIIPGRKYFIANVTGTYIIPNRWNIVVAKNQALSGSQATSEAIRIEDFRIQSFKDRVAASQTDLNKYQETRILLPKDMKIRALEAFKRSKQRQKELLQHELNIESGSD